MVGSLLSFDTSLWICWVWIKISFSFLVDKVTTSGSYFLWVVYLSVLCPADWKLPKCGWSLTPFSPHFTVFSVCDLAESRSCFLPARNGRSAARLPINSCEECWQWGLVVLLCSFPVGKSWPHSYRRVLVAGRRIQSFRAIGQCFSFWSCSLVTGLLFIPKPERSRNFVQQQ